MLVLKERDKLKYNREQRAEGREQRADWAENRERRAEGRLDREQRTGELSTNTECKNVSKQHVLGSRVRVGVGVQ